MTSDNKIYKECSKCKSIIAVKNIDTKWLEFGSYSLKMTICPECGAVVSIEYVEDPNLNVNFDERYYQY